MNPNSLSLALLMLLFLGGGDESCASEPVASGKRNLVAYFSKTGNTKRLADEIQRITGAASFRIVPVVPYPAEYDRTVEIARKERGANARPVLETDLKDAGSYEVIFLGFPNWWGTMPMAVFTFLESHDFSGKMIIPFVTHEGSAFGRSVEDIRKACPGSTVLEGLAIRGGDAAGAAPEVSRWIEGLDLGY